MIGQLSDWGCQIHTINEIVVETIRCTKWEACWIFLWGSQMSKSNLSAWNWDIIIIIENLFFFLIFSMLQPLEIKFIKNKNLLILVGSSNATFCHILALTNQPACLPKILSSFHQMLLPSQTQKFCPACETDDHPTIVSPHQFHTTSAHSVRMTVCLSYSRTIHPELLILCFSTRLVGALKHKELDTMVLRLE